MKTKDRDSIIKEENRLLMKKDKEFEKWWKVHFCDEQGNPLVFISLYKNTLDFKNYCKLAWEAGKEASMKRRRANGRKI